MIKWCKSCILPDSRPNLIIEKNGVCNACNNHLKKDAVDWEKREISFNNLINKIKKASGNYDCIIPVSGGKDSTWQVIKLLKYGLNPLAITWKPPGRNKIGQENLQNLINLGVDHIDFTVNPKIESSFMLESFKKFGSPLIPMHLAIYNLPIRVAYNFDIPLIVWGENSAYEYGGGGEKKFSKYINKNWVKKYGATGGTDFKDWLSKKFSEKDLFPYSYLDEEKIKKKKIMGIFLGHFFKWDPLETMKISQKQGFNFSRKHKITGFYDFADLDDNMISIHHWMKWYKFGFDRAFDNLSIEIRNKRISRENAKKKILKSGVLRPDEDIDYFCNYMKISQKDFIKISEKFRNKKIWKMKSGKWYIPNFLFNNWKW